MNKEEIIKIVRNLIDTPEHSEDVIDVCDRGENLIKLLQTEQLVLNGVTLSKIEGYQIDRALMYLEEDKQEILDFINRTNNLNNNIIISKGNALTEIETKISALEIAKNN